MQDKIRVLAIASGGGHWEQLMLLRPTLDKFDTHFATTNRNLADREGLEDVSCLPDANRHNKLAAVTCLWSGAKLIRKMRPDVVITTGALPGLIMLFVARMAGARTVWIDSVANSQRLSMSGRWARHVSTLWLTQWAELAREDGPVFRGSLL